MALKPNKKKQTSQAPHFKGKKETLSFQSSQLQSWGPRQVEKLLRWFKDYQRPLPWRKDRDPYKIWISEIMLQQTTSKAVIPYFERFIAKFPTPQSLAQASLDEVYELWAGLGYYSRARNIHKAAQKVHEFGFGKSYQDLIKLPGIGPYASRAISSQAFGEKVGVVDGNVNRVYCRLFKFEEAWWKTKAQKQIQIWADHLAKLAKNPSDLNQALMELGASVCTPQSPACLTCPLSADCLAYQTQSQDLTPIKKPKANKEIWLWEAQVYFSKNNQVFLTYYPKSEKNSYKNLPQFLSQKWVLPGRVKKLTSKPKDFDYKHNITRFEIYVKLDMVTKCNELHIGSESQSVQLAKLKKISPFSLVQKGIDKILTTRD